jgi:F-type H+-transporting ATPase subunit beta
MCFSCIAITTGAATIVGADERLCEGDYDHLPEQAFFMCGGIDEVEKNAADLVKK